MDREQITQWVQNQDLASFEACFGKQSDVYQTEHVFAVWHQLVVSKWHEGQACLMNYVSPRQSVYLVTWADMKHSVMMSLLSEQCVQKRPQIHAFLENVIFEPNLHLRRNAATEMIKNAKYSPPEHKVMLFDWILNHPAWVKNDIPRMGMDVLLEIPGLAHTSYPGAQELCTEVALSFRPQEFIWNMMLLCHITEDRLKMSCQTTPSLTQDQALSWWMEVLENQPSAWWKEVLTIVEKPNMQEERDRWNAWLPQWVCTLEKQLLLGDLKDKGVDISKSIPPSMRRI